MKKIKKTNPRLVALIDDLKAATRNDGSAIWRDVAKRLEKQAELRRCKRQQDKQAHLPR